MWQLADPRALLLALLPLAAALIFFFKHRNPRRRELLAMATPFTAMHEQSRRTRRAFRLLFLAGALALALLAFAIARPVRIHSWVKRVSEGIDIVITLDVSESMEANDLLPTRILSAKAVIRDFIRRRPDDRLGLVIFGGEAVTKCPLTRDFDFLISQVDDVRLRELRQGTAIGMGLASSIGRLRSSESKSKVIVLLTDGDSNVGAINPVTATHLARQEGIKIYTIGIGKNNRVVVPIYNYDMYGKRTQLIAQVPSYLNPELLQEIARLTGGKAYMARDSGMLNQILREIDHLERSKVKLIPMEKREDWFFWPAVAGSLLMLLLVLLQETRYRKARLRYAASL